MGQIIRTDEPQAWSERVGGGYQDVDELELAADMLAFDVKVGPRDPEHGFFMVPAYDWSDSDSNSTTTEEGK